MKKQKSYEIMKKRKKKQFTENSFSLKFKSGIKILLFVVFSGIFFNDSFISEAEAGVVLAENGKSKACIVLAENAAPPERTAANELATYLEKVTGSKFNIVDEGKAPKDGVRIYVGSTDVAKQHGINTTKLGKEEWIIRTIDNDLILTGGRPRGTLYAVYRFLEDTLGVHWWNPQEETVPEKPTLDLSEIDRHGKPAFSYRDVVIGGFTFTGPFAVRNRANQQGEDLRTISALIPPEYGGEVSYGLPYHLHTLTMYFPPGEYFKKHPEWFSLIKGKRTADRGQFCLTNQELREQVVKKLKSYIKASRIKAKAAGYPAPKVFHISQDAYQPPCQCEKCKKIVKNEEAASGLLIDFLNYISDAVRKDYPDVFIDTQAYHQTQKPPKNIKARDNIIIRLADVLSNCTKPVTYPDNIALKEYILGWSKKTKHLRIWDYATRWGGEGVGMPMPTVYTLPIDLKFYLKHGVEGVFAAQAHPVIGEMWDFKVWMIMKMLEDPYQDYENLVNTFTDGFYGPAGKYIREYLKALEASSNEKPSFLLYSPAISVLNYLDIDFIIKAQRIFDKAEKVVANDTVLLRRVRHARLSLDRATIFLFRRLKQQWIVSGKSLKDMPLDENAIIKRCLDTWRKETDRCFPKDYNNYWKKEHDAINVAEAEMIKSAALPVKGGMPAKFSKLPPETIHDFMADLPRCWRNVVKVVEDPTAESGITNRLEFAKRPAGKVPASEEYRYVDKYKLPMSWGIFDAESKNFIAEYKILPKDVPGPGYHWYKMGQGHAIRPAYFMYIFWSWIIQQDIGSAYDGSKPGQKFDVWARIKFEGPSFPYGKPEDKDAICVERVVVVKAE